MPPKNIRDRRKPRRFEYLYTVQNKFYLFCEGEKTEPNYFNGFKDTISAEPIYKNVVHIEVKGVGAETLRILNAAEKFVEDNNIHHAQIWCIYDKDSFPAQDFNAVSERIRVLNEREGRDTSVTYNAAWSNECIEYWFILHFDLYESKNNRSYYRKYLNEKFASLGLGRYKKNNKELFDILSSKGNPKLAIKRARQRVIDCTGRSDSNSVPATKVHLLVEELAKYLPDKLKSRYI